ncbi:cell wall-active antibiotics response protein LiaF [Ornithinibacillus californiensis]|uniref:cell wall-active antibiotics response protein LiaF n=1 Tax=Ornithinibacillus californiensis TaxID=161536 RepID=UPI00064D8A19|nr:cell wall-active antibiotics response protein LiaF [Ornithinibacillus californiensis]
MKVGFFRYLIAAVLIAFGVVLVLENIGVMEFNIKNAWSYIYPSLFVLFGLKWIIERMRHRGGSWIWGSFFLIFGSLLLMDRFDVIAFAFNDVFKLWPLLIVYFGFMFIGKSGKPKVIIHNGGSKVEKDENSSFFTVGNHEFNQPNWKVEPTTVKTLAGDFYYDFSKAYIPEKEIPISISSLAGDVHILVPENLEFQINASVKAGDIDIVGQSVDGINRSLSYVTPNYDTAKRRINFTLKLKAGSIRVDYV